MNSQRNYRRNLLAQSLAVALLLPAISQAQTTPAPAATPAAPAETETLDRVEVVGSRIKRSQIEGPSPVTIISSEQIEAEGFNTVHDVLETVAQNNGFSQNDFNAAGGFTPNAGVINLRGLGPGRTLLLINGRRAMDYPFPYNGRSNFQNFNNIPAGAVERIEILAGGASAIYGSDAVAGVVNVVLKNNFEGDTLSWKGQTSSRGGRDIMDLQWVGGRTGDNWSVTYAVEAYSAEPLFAYQREFMDSGADNPTPPGVGGAAGVGGYQPPIGIQLRRLSATGATLSYVMPAGRDCSGSAFFRPHTYTSAVSGATFGPGCGYDRFVAEQTVLNGNDDVSAYLYGTYTFENNMEGWFSAMAYKSDARLGGGVEQWFGGPQPNGTFFDPVLGIRAFPIRVMDSNVYGGSEGTFQKFNERSYDLAVGLRGSFSDRFDWDFTLSNSEYHAVRDRPRMTVAGATNYFMGARLGTTGVGPYVGLVGIPNGLPVYVLNQNRFFGPISLADYRSMSTMVHYDARSDNSTANFTVTGDLWELPAGPIGFAGILEWSSQSYDLDSDRRLLPDVREIYNLTGTGGGGERDRYAIGVEFSIPLHETLTMSLAGRFDKYDDITNVDDAKTWNAGIEWRPLDNLLIRGSYSTSFKAPDMHYVFAERSGAFGGITDFARCARDGIAAAVCSGAGANYNYSAFTTSQGQPGLEEETGKSFTVGFVWDIIDNLALSVDYYEIELENAVQVRSGTQILGDEYGCATGFYPNGRPFPYAAGTPYCNEIATRISRDPLNDGRISEIRSGPINLAFNGVKGADATLRYRWDTDRWGNFNASIAWSHVLEKTEIVNPGDPLQQVRDINTNPDFRSRVRATLSWQKGDWDATIFANRVGSFPIWNPGNSRVTSGELSGRTAPFVTYNLSVGHQVTEMFGVRLNINNVLNKISPGDPTFNAFPYFWQAFSPVGREVGLEFNVKFH